MGLLLNMLCKPSIGALKTGVASTMFTTLLPHAAVLVPLVYARAGLPGWGDGQRPASRVRVLDARVGGLRLRLPWGCHVGRAIKLLELWAKAARLAAADELRSLRHLAALRDGRAPGRRSVAAAGVTPGASGSGPALYTEVRLQAKAVSFKVEQHPMEAWLAVHGPLLRSTATQQHLWLHRIKPQVDVGDVVARAASADRPIPDTQVCCASTFLLKRGWPFAMIPGAFVG